MQPPDTHPTLFFLFDFIRNTHKQVQSIDPAKLRDGDANTKNSVAEVVGRNRFAKTLIDDRTGKLALLTGGDPGRPVDFGEEIREKARVLA
ncbi:hypothetical protein PISL3812_00260 [Talaromyces islandicus]|uniref:Uncharacterized protein n=1 Tax=Talaromyces islandicus TaxID=28573 RepID=A0A0U1LIV3_TALIS|nr:hypothetical protein PISL3812_00260 [Talaromyces islandicus]